MGRTVLITGTNRGIGKAILERFSEEEDITILAHARKESDKFSKLLEDIESEHQGVTLVPVYFDLKYSDQIKSSLKGALALYKKIDVLVNNAGIMMPCKPFLMTDMAQIRETFEVNFFAQVQITQIVTRAMIRNRGGAIVNIASVAALSGVEGQFDYTASKTAIVGMTRRLSSELGAYNIRCNAVAPGMIETDMIYQIDDESRENLLKNRITKRLGSAENVADAVYFLGSDASEYINGQILKIDGGGISYG